MIQNKKVMMMCYNISFWGLEDIFYDDDILKHGFLDNKVKK